MYPKKGIPEMSLEWLLLFHLCNVSCLLPLSLTTDRFLPILWWLHLFLTFLPILRHVPLIGDRLTVVLWWFISVPSDSLSTCDGTYHSCPLSLGHYSTYPMYSGTGWGRTCTSLHLQLIYCGCTCSRLPLTLMYRWMMDSSSLWCRCDCHERRILTDCLVDESTS